MLTGVDVTEAKGEAQRKLRQTVQIVFQDPYGSLNPRQKIGAILEEPLVINRKMSAAERREAAEAMMARVGLRPAHYQRPPNTLYGAQRQRIAIAPPLILDPDMVDRKRVDVGTSAALRVNLHSARIIKKKTK